MGAGGDVAFPRPHEAAYQSTLAKLEVRAGLQGTYFGLSITLSSEKPALSLDPESSCWLYGA